MPEAGVVHFLVESGAKCVSGRQLNTGRNGPRGETRGQDRDGLVEMLAEVFSSGAYLSHSTVFIST